MCAAPAPAPADDRPDDPASDAQNSRPLLRRLLDRAVDLADMVHPEAQAAAPTSETSRAPGGDPPPGPRPWKRRTPADIATLCARAAWPAAPPRQADPGEPERTFHLIASPDRE